MKAHTCGAAAPIDVHAPDLWATLNRRARTDRAALMRDLLALAKDRPADFSVLVGEVLAPAAAEGLGLRQPAALLRSQGTKGRRAP